MLVPRTKPRRGRPGHYAPSGTPVLEALSLRRDVRMMSVRASEVAMNTIRTPGLATWTIACRLWRGELNPWRGPHLTLAGGTKPANCVRS